MTAYNGQAGDCLELILTSAGGAELMEHVGKAHRQLWASDSDEDFREEFPDVLDENDVEHVLDYLVDKELLDEEDADECEVSLEALGPGDEEDDDDDGDEFASGEPLTGEFIPAPGHGE